MHRFLVFMFLMATLLPLGYLLFVFIYFEWLVEQQRFHEDWRTQAFAAYNFSLSAIYCWLVYQNENIPKESKINWYVGFIVAMPFAGAYYWCKEIWPRVNQ